MSLVFTYHLAQACLVGYTGYLSHNAITRLLGYEEKAETAAQYSNTAAEQLHKTRTTQTAGAVSVSPDRVPVQPHWAFLTTVRLPSL